MYFITLCAWRRECQFCVINDNQMQLSRLGEIVQEEWCRSAQIRREIELDEFIIMPNQMHGIVQIVDLVGVDGIRPKNTHPDDLSPVDADAGQDGERPGGASLVPLRVPGNADQPEGVRRTPLRREGRSLGSFVAGFKAAVTARARGELDIQDVWQRNCYEHVIRDQEDYENIRAYIQTNPLRWEEDQLA